MTNIILCGGNGTRLWPLSRTLMPKQFLKFFNDKSLFQLTVERNAKLCDSQLIVSNTDQYFLAIDQLDEITTHYPLPTTHFLLEPIGRNTAPAIALTCMALDRSEIVLVTPSDHLIKNEKEYQTVVRKANELAQKDFLVTFGIEPTEPNTGYGYIEAEASSTKSEALSVKKFHEKPDLKTAEKYLEQNKTTHYPPPTTHYLWNSGMFCFKAGIFLEELRKYAPKIYKTCAIAFENMKIQNLTLRIQHSWMESIPSESIDYAVMEKSNIVKVVPSDIGWSDVGSFDSLCEELKMDDEEWIIEEESKDNFYYSDDKDKVIATIGLEEYIVINTKDALLISKKEKSQKVKEIVNKLKTTHYPLLTTHSTVHRPWGTYETLIEDNGYKIKRIVVKPGKRLSLQKHFHRNEHWIVVSGSATITVEDKHFILNPNESTYIKAGQTHRLENQGKLPLIMIEAQVGEYTGEDDIVRLSDDYHRASSE